MKTLIACDIRLGRLLSTSAAVMSTVALVAADIRWGPAPLMPTNPPATTRQVAPAAPGTGGFSVDVSSREAVRQFHRAVYGASEGIEIGWTGGVATCDPGTTRLSFQEAVIRRVNYYRAMAGVPAEVTLDTEHHAAVQSAAFIMSVNQFIGHDLPDTAQCYTVEADEAAGKSNLSLGAYGPTAIDGYMVDPGPYNGAVGHRRWLLFPQETWMATGDVPPHGGYDAANALYVLGGPLWNPRPPVRDDFVAWPPPGYVPYEVVPVRWSFSYPDADFSQTISQTNVTVTQGGTAIPVTLEEFSPNRGENTLVWYFSSLDPADTSYQWPRPDQDTVYTVRIDGVLIDGQSRSFEYQVIVFDPAMPGPDTVLPDLSGPATLQVGQTATYAITPVPNVDDYEWIAAQAEWLTRVEGADEDLGLFEADTTPGYDPRGQKPKFQGEKCFLLTHVSPTPEDQYLTHTGVLLPQAGATLDFEARLSNAASGQIGMVQVSVDGGISWETIFERAGDDNDLLGDVFFHSYSLPLTAYEGRLTRLRFVYHHVPGTPYVPWNPGVDWQNGIGFYIENVSFSNVRILTNIVSQTSLGVAEAAFTPSSAGPYALAARGLLFGEYPLEYGHATFVEVTEPPLILFTGQPQLAGNDFQAEVQVTPATTGLLLRVETATSLAGPWTEDPDASVETIEEGTRYRVRRPAGGATRFLRVRVDP